VPGGFVSKMLVAWRALGPQGGRPPTQYRADRALLDELSQAMSQTSICGLGQIVPAPIQSVLKHFKGEIQAHAEKGECPSGICFSTANKMPELQRVGIRP